MIPGSVNNSTNETKVLQSSEVRTKILTDGVATLTGGRLSNLNNATDPLDVATKNDVDSFIPSTGASSLLTGIQLKVSTISGPNFGSSVNLTFTDSTLNVNGTVTNNFITMVPSATGGKIFNLSDPINSQDAATKNYVINDNINVHSLSTITDSNNLVPSFIVNKILERTTTSFSTVQDIMPTPTDLINSLTSPGIGTSFTFVYKYLSNDPPYIALYFNGNGVFPQGNIYAINNQTNVVTVESGSMIAFTGVVMSVSPALVNFYINNVQASMTSDAQITSEGLITSVFSSRQLYTPFNNSLIIYPVVKTDITSANYTYSSADISKLLITRGSGFVANGTDTFDDASVFLSNNNFSLGSGAFKFYIRNISPTYTLTLDTSSAIGWTQSPSSIIIPTQSCATLYIFADTVNSVCKLLLVSIMSLNGV